MFVDKASVTVQAGNGGTGLTSFRRERYVAHGGPDGGDGGDGGDVIVVASHNQNTLADFRNNKLVKAEDGDPGGRRKQHGKRGSDIVINLPVGTVIMDGDEIVADLSTDGQREVIAKGGKGGFGNAHFTSSIRQAPRISENGEPGQKLEATLELKMIADVGLVGLPNAGKSTLLSVITSARPEIADYPFTTLRPNLGVADIDGEHSLLVADIPGLIEGASQGKGLGDDFLRHIERTNVVIHLIDAYEDEAVAYKTIMGELAAYQVDLSRRPQIIALTKTEGLEPGQINKKIAKLKKLAPRGTQVLAISATANKGLKPLLRLALKKVTATRKKKEIQKSQEVPVITLTEDPEVWEVKKAKSGYLVTGKKIERFAVRAKMSEPDGRQRLMDIMKKMGIMRELTKQGIKHGQTINIGEPSVAKIEY